MADQKPAIPNVWHIVCGEWVMWRLSTDTKPGGPYCVTCKREVEVEELSRQTSLCVASA